MKRNVLLGLITFLLVTPPTYGWQEPQHKPAKYETIQVYETNKLDQPFEVIGKIHAKSSTLKALIFKVKKAAARKGGDAVLLYKVNNTASISWWTGGQMSYAEGVAVRFSEHGIEEITEKTPIPVIEQKRVQISG